MAVTAMNDPLPNTYRSGEAASITREDLAPLIYEVDSAETPVVTALRQVEATNVLVQWAIKQLNKADDNAQKEGFRYAAQPTRTKPRLTNICQILARGGTVSGSVRGSDTLDGDQYLEEMLDAGRECRRDLEYIITRDFVAVDGDPRHMAGIPGYLLNGSVGAGGDFPTGNGSDAHTPGADRDLSLDLVADALEQAYDAGGAPDMGIVSPGQKRAFSRLAAGGASNPIAAQNIVQATSPMPITIVGAVDVYLSDFGRLELAPDRFAPKDQMLILDQDYLELAPLDGRNMEQQDYAKTGDATDGAIVFEGCVRVTGPDACAAIWDLNIPPLSNSAAAEARRQTRYATPPGGMGMMAMQSSLANTQSESRLVTDNSSGRQAMTGEFPGVTRSAQADEERVSAQSAGSGAAESGESSEGAASSASGTSSAKKKS